ncbi:MAG: hypothetical protein ACTSPV_18865 [Candidatus Hodarchaeales archaeon]
MRSLSFMLVLVCSVILLMSTSGCLSSIQDLDDIVKPPVPTPQQQVWNAVKKSNWLVTISILGMAVGFFAFLNGNKLGVPFVGASCISLFMALAVARFATLIAILGLIGSIVSTVLSILSRRKALEEVVKGFQYVKDELLPQKKRTKANEIMASTQKSKSTRKMVQQIKANLKLKGEI